MKILLRLIASYRGPNSELFVYCTSVPNLDIHLVFMLSVGLLFHVWKSWHDTWCTVKIVRYTTLGIVIKSFSET